MSRNDRNEVDEKEEGERVDIPQHLHQSPLQVVLWVRSYYQRLTRVSLEL